MGLGGWVGGIGGLRGGVGVCGTGRVVLVCRVCCVCVCVCTEVSGARAILPTRAGSYFAFVRPVNVTFERELVLCFAGDNMIVSLLLDIRYLVWGLKGNHKGSQPCHGAPI